MKFFLSLVSLMIFSLSFAQAAPGFRKLHGEVTKIVDGDTVHFRDSTSQRGQSNAADLKIRMVNMDAPESHFRAANGAMVAQTPFGEKAGAYLAHLIPEGTKADLMSFDIDKYHRVLGVLVLDGKDVNLKMVREGWAIPYIICEGSRCDKNFFQREHIEAYLKACDAARGENKGIWDPAHPLKEMPFEFRLRNSGRKPEKFVGDYTTHKLYAPSEYRHVDVCKRIFFMKEAEANAVDYR